MRAWQVHRPGPIDQHPLRLIDKTPPVPGPDELLVRVRACAVCRTDLHVAEGDLPVHRPNVTPGHEVVGTVSDLGADVVGYLIGERVGIAWLRHTCGVCDYCQSGRENLCLESRYTGWDADGGYADYAIVPADYAYHLPDNYADAELAPLLCAGIIGYRSLRRTDLPPGGRLGIYGFGASAHLATQVALAEGATVHVVTRSPAARRLALELGAASARDEPPEKLDAAIMFAPAGTLVPAALEALDRGGILTLAGIYLSQVPPLDYDRHLFYEREIRSVTANTRKDGHDFLAFATRTKLTVRVTLYPMDAAERALADLAAGNVGGAAVLTTDQGVDPTAR
jgi:propanol-preferring alcohol dehydrogenase